MSSGNNSNDNSTPNPSGGSTHSVPGPNPRSRLTAQNHLDGSSAENGSSGTAGAPPPSQASSQSTHQQDRSGEGDSSQDAAGADNSARSAAPTGTTTSAPACSNIQRLRSSSLSATVPSGVPSSIAPTTAMNIQDKSFMVDLAMLLAGRYRDQLGGDANGHGSSTSHSAIKNPSDAILFRATDEVHRAAYEHEVAISPEISILASKGIRPPLTLFSNDALKALGENPAAYRKKYSLSSGAATLVDIGAFGRETELDSELWKECFGNYLRWYRTVAEKAVADRWQNHFEALSGLRFLKSEFSAVLTFDIQERTDYAARPFPFQEDVWWARLQSSRQEALKRANEAKYQILEAAMLHISGPVRSDRNASLSRYQPYPTSPSGRNSPFPAGKPAPLAPRLCLRCGRENEVAGSCSHSTTIRDKPIIAIWDSATHSLVSLADPNFSFCFPFNLGGPDMCDGDHATHITHACSICGEFDHHAATGYCSL